MANRIQQWWEDVKKWQVRFEKLFGLPFTGSKAFKKELLKKYEQVLSRKTKGITEDERMTKKSLKQKHRELEQELYPNRYLRIFRHLFKSLMVLGQRAVPRRNSKRNVAMGGLERKGFGVLKDDIRSAIIKGKSEVALSESLTPTENLDYKFKFDHNSRGGPKLNGYIVGLHNGNGKPVASLLVEEGSSLSKENVRGLLNGRPVNFGSIWKIPDLNDQDAEGNIKVKDVIIGDYKIEVLLDKLPIKDMDENRKRELVADLKNGQAPEVTLMFNGKEKTVNLIANPIKREVQLMENGRKVTLEKLQGPNERVVKMEIVKKDNPAAKKSVRVKRG